MLVFLSCLVGVRHDQSGRTAQIDPNGRLYRGDLHRQEETLFLTYFSYTTPMLYYCSDTQHKLYGLHSSGNFP